MTTIGKIDDIITERAATAAEVNGFPREELEPLPVVDASRPEIDTANLGLDAMAAAAWAAIDAANAPPRIYLYGGALAWLVADAKGQVRIEMMQRDHVRHHLAEVAAFTRWTLGGRTRAPEKKPAFPPVPLAADLLAVPRASLPNLHRLVHVPVFAADGRLITEAGFDEASGLYFAPPTDFTLAPVSSMPSTRDIVAAREVLCTELLGDFPFEGDADRAHAVALLLTPLLRELVPGCVPLFVVSKPTPRAGAGLLMKVVSIVQTGAPVAATTIGRDEEEMRKRLTALLIPSPAIVLLDNLHGRLDSAALAAILTTAEWEDRQLGHSKTIRLVVRSTFAVTGNNVTLSNEMTGRSVLIRLDPKMEDPSTRTGFRHPKLEVWTREHRRRLLWAALTLGQAWIAAGRPMANVAFGGFEAWGGVLGGVLHVAGIAGFLANRTQLFENADDEGANTRAFLADWWSQHGSETIATKSLLETAKQHALDIAGKTDQAELVRLGQLLASLVDRAYNLGDGLVVAVRRAGERQRAVLWTLNRESLVADSPETHSSQVRSTAGVGESGEFSESHNPARGRERARNGIESAGGDSPRLTDSLDDGLDL